MKNGRRLGPDTTPKPYQPPAVPEGRINLTDPDSRVVKGLRGFIPVLDRAGLVEGRREGREVRYTVRTEPLGETARWMAGIASQWDARLAAIKRIAEAG